LIFLVTVFPVEAVTGQNQENFFYLKDVVIFFSPCPLQDADSPRQDRTMFWPQPPPVFFLRFLPLGPTQVCLTTVGNPNLKPHPFLAHFGSEEPPSFSCVFLSYLPRLLSELQSPCCDYVSFANFFFLPYTVTSEGFL